MSSHRLLAATGVLIAAGSFIAPPTLAGPLDWIQFPGVCYDYDPHDKFHLYGKYYPYSGDECRERRLLRAHKPKARLARAARGERCIRSNIRHQRNACPD